MFIKQKFNYLKDNYHYINDLFINGKQGQLIIEPLTVFKRISSAKYGLK